MKHEMTEEKSTKLLSAGTIVSCYDIGHTTLHKLVKTGLLTPIRFSKRLVRYRASEVEALIEAIAKNGGVL